MMPSYYTIVRYVPDPVIDERINIGVLVASDGKVFSRFVEDWNRIATFGDEDIEFLQDFAREADKNLSNAISALVSEDSDAAGEQVLRQIAGQWINSIQFSEPRASLLPIQRLLDGIASQFLRYSAVFRSNQLLVSFESARPSLSENIGPYIEDHAIRLSIGGSREDALSSMCDPATPRTSMSSLYELSDSKQLL